MVTKTVAFNVVLLASVTSFVLGIYFQHDKAVRNIRKLLQSDPYAFQIRDKLYDVLGIFSVKPAKEQSRMEQIMKYGFPGLDDIRLYSDFVLSYDRRNRVAHWVYEHLRASCLSPDHGVHRRLAEYVPDMEIPSKFRSLPDDYHRSGFDRGHLASAGNHKCLQNHCNETFYLTNITPQVGKGFNRDAWNKLEIYVRELTEKYGSVYVCTGPLYMPKRQNNGKMYVEYELIGRNTVAVPTHFFKVITVESKLPEGKPYMEAYIMPNTAIDEDVDIRSFLSEIRVIERSAGLQFFNGLRRSYFFATNYSTTPELYENFS